jgi:hypothetical protein
MLRPSVAIPDHGAPAHMSLADCCEPGKSSIPQVSFRMTSLLRCDVQCRCWTTVASDVEPWDTWETSRAEFLTRMVEVKDITWEHQ